MLLLQLGQKYACFQKHNDFQLKNSGNFVIIPSIMTTSRQAAVKFIFITLLIDVMGWGLIIPVMPELISQLKGIAINEASSYGAWLLFAYSGMQFICAPLSRQSQRQVWPASHNSFVAARL